MNSKETMKLWKEYKDKAIKRGVKEDGIWGLNWKQPFDYENYDALPK